MMRFLNRKRCANAEHRVKMERLERAEDELRVLKARADRAIGVLDAREKRNHWREAIDSMIQGAP